MHDVLRTRLLRKMESLPEEQIYQVLDYIEFLESKYARALGQEASGIQKIAENLEDRMRKRAFSPATLREAFQLLSAADKALQGVTKAGKQLLDDLAPGSDDRLEEGRGRRDEGPTGGSTNNGDPDHPA